MGVFIFLLEFTFLAKCIRGTDRIIEMSTNLKMKVGIYTIGGNFVKLILAVLMWLSLMINTTTLVICALTLTLTSGCYLMAIIRHEDPAHKSGVISQQGIARSVVSRI